MSKVDANSEIHNGEVELNRIGNLDTIAISMKLSIRVLYLVSSREVDEDSKWRSQEDAISPSPLGSNNISPIRTSKIFLFTDNCSCVCDPPK